MESSTTMTDEQKRIRGYLEAQGAKLAPAAIVEKVREAMGRLRAAALTVPAARFAESPAPGEWSANEVMAHVVDAGRHFGEGIVRALDGQPPGERRHDEERPTAPRQSATEWLTILDRDREALFERALHAEPTARLEQSISHGFFGRLNWRETLLFIRIHDIDHAGQLEKIAAALGSRA
jgi:uncharacterized damage-inducible protein DinB